MTSSSETGNVRVLVRVRPLNNSELTEHGSCGRSNVLSVEANANGQIDFNGENKENGASIIVNSSSDNRNLENGKQFTFDAVHGENSTQEEVYNSVKGIVDAVVEGYNGTIVAYGQTGSGKTHTVFGSGVRGDHNGVGIVQRSLRDIFSKFTLAQAQKVDENPGASSKTTFRGSFVEIFNERVYDLLSPETLDNNLQVRENVRGGGVYIEGLKEVELQNTAEAESLMSAALANRHVASTNMNRTSSRSHAMFVLSVRTEHIDEDGLRKVRNSKFTLVDLAGSERQKSTGTSGNRLKEASMINKSLLCLGEVINKLVDREHGKSRHIPFRNSKLTFLLKDTWGGNSKTCLVATVSPSAYAQGETLSTLQFAQRAKLVKNNAILNEDTCGTVAALQAELARLQSELKGNNFPALDTCSSNDQDTLLSLKRQNERKEKKIDELHRVLEEERNLCNTLKRKLQEESFSRKLKERRLENVERKNKKDVTESEQVEMLKMEIKSLQQRLDAPSEDAIKWRVAYEEAQEALEEKMKYASDDIDVVALEERNLSLEETVDRLMAEKLDLESKVADLTESSNETQQEIDSIMNEVDVLEKEMHDLQDQLEIKNQEYETEKGRANKNEALLHDLTSKLDLSSKTRDELEDKVRELQGSLNNLKEEITAAHVTLKEKDDTLNEIEELLEQKERDFESKIEYMRKELEESNFTIKARDDLIETLNDRVNNASNVSESNNAHLQSSLLDLECEKAKVVELQNKINSLMTTNEEEIKNIKQEHDKSEGELKDQINDMERKIKELHEEILNQDSIIDTVKQQLDEAQKSVEEKETAIIEYEKLSEDSSIIEKEMNDEINELQKSIDESKFALEENKTKLKNAEEEKEKLESLVKQYEMESRAQESQLNSLRNDLDCLKQEKEHLQKQLESQQQNQNNVSEEVAELQKQLELSEMHIKSLVESHASTLSDLRSSKEESQRKHLEALFGMESEQKNLLQEIESLSKALAKSQEETNLFAEKIQEKDNDISSLKLQISSYESSENEKTNEAESEVSRLAEEKFQLLKDYDDIKRQLTSKAEEVDGIRFDLEASNTNVAQLRIKLENIVGEKEQLEANHEESLAKNNENIQRLTEEKELLAKKFDALNQQISTFIKIQEKCEALEKENEGLRNKCEISQNAAEENAKKLAGIEKMTSESKTKLENTIVEKNNEIEALREKIFALERDLSSTHEAAVKDLENTVQKLHTEKEDLEFQLDSLREDQDATLEESLVFQKELSALKAENEELKRLITNLRANNESKTLASKSSSIISSGSTWASDNGTATLEAAVQESPETPPSSQKSPTTEAVGADESFDEDIFLPDDFLPNSDDGASSSANDCVNQSSAIVVSSSTPLKTCDYGKRRVPLSDRKNTMTPHKSTSKKLKSTSKFMASARKLMSSSKKKRDSDYMVFNNKRLFGE